MVLREHLSCILVVFFLALPCSSFLASAEHPAEDQNFVEPHTASDFPVGWSDQVFGTFPSVEYRILYPAMNSGEDKEMAGNGPFPHIQFFIDSGEDSTSYMDLVSRLAQRGYIVAVHDESFDSTDFDDILSATVAVHKSLQQLNNSSSSSISGTFGQFDLNHWGLGGHGIGAAAAYGAYPYWMNSTFDDDVQPPRALFGVGTDFDEWGDEHWGEHAPSGWIHSPASPSAGLFLTGSADDIAPSSEVQDTLSNGDGLAWQLMEVVGADHYQYQDSTSFLEGLQDGDASITQDEQNSIASQHITAYLDLTLRGSHEHFRTAFNRPLGPHVVSDSDAYIVEDLSDGQFLLVLETSTAPNETDVLGPQSTLNVFVEWSLRDGTSFSQLPSQWELEIECHIDGMNSTSGSFDSNGTALCLFPMQDVAPGFHIAYVKVLVEGASSIIELPFNRTDAPLVLSNPIPEIAVEQRSSVHLDASEFAYDPDGQEVFFHSASLQGNFSADFSITIDQDKRGMTVYHSVNEEQLDGTEINLTLRAGGSGIIDEASVNTSIRVIPIDDPVVKITDVPMQNLVEDGLPVLVDLYQYVSDPEGGVLYGSLGGETQGNFGPVGYSIVDGVLTLSPLPNQNGATIMRLLVDDGVTAPLELDVPLYVEPVNDEIIVNHSAWNISVMEDATLLLNLTELAWDLDNDNLFWTVESSSNHISVVRSTDQLIVTPTFDFYGFDSGSTVNVTDGTLGISKALNITVIPVPDAPVLSLQELNLIDASAASLQWWVFDADGVSPTNITVEVNGVLLENLTHSCVYDSNDLTNRCLSMLPFSETQNGSLDVRVGVFDEELAAETVAFISLNLTSNPPDSSNDAASEELESTDITLIAGISLIVTLLLFVMVAVYLKGSNSSTKTDLEIQEVDLHTEQHTENSGGLLARAKGKL